MNSNQRYLDQGKHLTVFADEVLVRCARCDTQGLVKAEWMPYRWKAHFHCAACDLHLNSELQHWAGPVTVSGRRPCGHCGHKWLSPTVDLPELPADPVDELEALCPECGRTSKVKMAATPSVPGDRCIDPHFGLPLYLALPSRLGMVWAYNARHLAELQGYVVAKLRVRQMTGNNSAMFSRLPLWMKLSKHREEVTKILSKLEKRLALKPPTTNS